MKILVSAAQNFKWRRRFAIAFRASAFVVLAVLISPLRVLAFTQDEFQEHIAALKAKLPSDDFTIVVEPPFVVIGDESGQQVKARAVDTVKWAVDRLKSRYFQHDPQFIIDVWLFRDKDSYEQYAEK